MELTEQVHQMHQYLASTRRHLIRALDPIKSGQISNSASAALTFALQENDQAFASLVKLRWSLFRQKDTRQQNEVNRVTRKDETQENLNLPDPIVYVVDDDSSMRRALERLLKSISLDYRTFSSAKEFLDYDRPEVPSCVVLDVRMPRMSGLDLQKELEKRKSIIPIIFITGHGDINMAVKAMKDGAQDFLPKPFHDQDLLDSINRALSGYEELQITRLENRAIWERINRLTPREREVMEMLITGMLNKQVAYDLGASEKTIKVHRGRIMEKMEAESLVELVRMTGRVGIEGPENSENRD